LPDKDDYEQWCRRYNIGDAPVTKQLYENRKSTVREYVSRYRKAGINQVLPGEAENMSVEDALRVKIVGGVNIRKLITSGNEKFRKG
jgi:hypothetical protein